MSKALSAQHVLEYPYQRSTGPVIGAFLAGLRERRVVGIRASDGRVLVPPQEYDPRTSEPLTELVEVADTGTVESWSWSRGVAWALVRLDGADTAMLHRLDAAGSDAVETGMRVRIRWAAERRATIHDIAAFAPTEPGFRGIDPTDSSLGDGSGLGEAGEPVASVATPIRLEYTYTPGPAAHGFLRGTQERRLVGRRCSVCAKVYMPPRGVCSMCGAAFTDEAVPVADTGTVTTFAIVNVNFASREVELPYAAVEVRFDGADITSQFLIQGVAHDQVRMGMRVRAVWKEGDLEPTLSNVTHVEPIDEPDAAYETISEFM